MKTWIAKMSHLTTANNILFITKDALLANDSKVVMQYLGRVQSYTIKKNQSALSKLPIFISVINRTNGRQKKNTPPVDRDHHLKLFLHAHSWVHWEICFVCPQCHYLRLMFLGRIDQWRWCGYSCPRCDCEGPALVKHFGCSAMQGRNWHIL